MSSKTPLYRISGYATGDGATSLVMNGIFGFCLLYYTQVLGLDYKLAAIALSIATFWDAITDPVMGYISDNTRSRHGNRHPYMLVGGVLMAICFYFLWAVPAAFKTGALLFWYLAIINILLRTAMTVYLIPYTALGFEICTDYDERAKLQGARWIANMMINLAGPAAAWSIFFRESKEGIDGAEIPVNFVHMGTVFSFGILAFVLIVLLSTKKYMKDNRGADIVSCKRVRGFFKDFKDILIDKYARIVFFYTFLVVLGSVIVTCLQAHIYIYFMEFSAGEKTFVSSASMIGFMLGAAVCFIMVVKFDKKKAVCIAVVLSVISNFVLGFLLLTKTLNPADSYDIPEQIALVGGLNIPVATMIFVILHFLFWMGNGVMTPIGTAMIADISEINQHNSGVLKDGGYAAAYTFLIKTAMSIGIFISGYALAWSGFVTGNETQSSQAINNLAIVFFFGGPTIMLIASLILLRYPINREFIQKIKARNMGI